MADGQSHKHGASRVSLKGASAGAAPRFKRPKTSKACNACRTQKSRCERLAGDAEGCHRCSVIGIPCVFDLEASSGDSLKTRKPRPILPRNQSEPAGIRPEPLDNSRLHILANTTALLSQETHNASSHSFPSHLASQSQQIPASTTTSIPLSPETLSTVESTICFPHAITFETESARFRAEWQRRIAPLKFLRTIVKQCADENSSHCIRDTVLLSAAEEAKLKNYFSLKYSPWLPSVRLGQNGNPDKISPFLSAVIYATASRTFGEISKSTMDGLRGQVHHHLGQTFTDPSAYPLVESLYALLVLILWPLDAADDVALLVDGAKRIADSGHFSGMLSTTNQESSQNLDHMRLWYAICVNETITTLGAGTIATSPDMSNFTRTLGTGPQIASRGGSTSDILLAMQLYLHDITTAAMAERPFSLDKNTPEIPHPIEAIYKFIRTVNVYLTRLDEWEIEFSTIAAECKPQEAACYAMLQFEYHYFCLMFLTHAMLTTSYACPIFFAPKDVRSFVWSWCLIANKNSLATVRLFNTHTLPDPHTEEDNVSPLITVPDRVFAMVVLAIMAVLRQQVVSAEYAYRRGQPDTSRAGFTRQAIIAIQRAVERMRQVGHGKGVSMMYYHSAPRYADILEALLRIWDEKFARNVASLVPREGDHSYVEDYRMKPPESSSGAGSEFDSGGVRITGHVGSSLPQMHQGAMGGIGQLDLDISLLGGVFFSDPSTTFVWEGLGTNN